ncbi:uncharacterized protein [Anabrus simplex]|uniref:uncharacterized protein n=1 Tax=Anabrus simplex TaxID=316456 RepID=UPI0034DD7EDF
MHAVGATMRRVGHIDVLVNNADHMITSPVPWDEVLLRRLFDKNVFPHFWVIKGILPHMLNANKGHIIGITPATELSAVSKDVPRAACKFAISGMMEALLQEIRLVPGNKVRMTCVHPYCPPCKQAAYRQLKFRITPRTTEEMAKDILKGIKSGHDVFSVPRKIYWYTNILRCLPQDVQVFWRDYVYRSTYEEDQLPREETFHIPISNFRFTGENVSRMLEYPSSPAEVYFKKPDSAITEVSIPVPEEADADWKLVVSKSPTEGQPVVFFSKEEWNMVSQGTSKTLLHNNSQLHSLNLPSTSTSPPKYADNLKEIMSDSGSTLDAPYSETPPPEEAQPSLLSKITDNLLNKDWLSTLYKPLSNLVLPSSRHSTVPWTLNIPNLFASESQSSRQSMSENHNLSEKVSHNPSVREMESSYSCKNPDHHHQHIVAFTESEYQLKVTNFNDKTEHTSKAEDEILIADQSLDDPSQSTEEGVISQIFNTPLQTPLQSATSKFSQYSLAHDQSQHSHHQRRQSQDSLK